MRALAECARVDSHVPVSIVPVNVNRIVSFGELLDVGVINIDVVG